jgi:hypothetical protein
MAYDVFPLPARYTLTHGIKFITLVGNMGDGFEQRINKNLSWGSRGDGQGTPGGASYKGLNTFKFSLKNLPHINASATAYANVLWDFYVDHLGNLVAFYFYNPIEQAIDLTATIVTGRYLVRFVDNNLTRENFVLRLFNATVDLIETRA